MSKGTLTPFDYDMIAMIESVLKTKVTVYLEEGYIKLEALAETTPNDELIALENAVKGRTGERFISCEKEDNIVIIRFDSDPEQWPTQMRFDFIEPVDVAYSAYSRKPKDVNAVLFDREKLQNVIDFTGGGILTIPRMLDEPATFEFANESGLFLIAKEGEYIVKDNTRYSIASRRDFENEFEAK
jgi:hypothetical protein